MKPLYCWLSGQFTQQYNETRYFRISEQFTQHNETSVLQAIWTVYSTTQWNLYISGYLDSLLNIMKPLYCRLSGQLLNNTMTPLYCRISGQFTQHNETSILQDIWTVYSTTQWNLYIAGYLDGLLNNTMKPLYCRIFGQFAQHNETSILQDIWTVSTTQWNLYIAGYLDSLLNNTMKPLYCRISGQFTQQHNENCVQWDHADECSVPSGVSR